MRPPIGQRLGACLKIINQRPPWLEAVFFFFPPRCSLIANPPNPPQPLVCQHYSYAPLRALRSPLCSFVASNACSFSLWLQIQPTLISALSLPIAQISPLESGNMFTGHLFPSLLPHPPGAVLKNHATTPLFSNFHHFRSLTARSPSITFPLPVYNTVLSLLHKAL